MWNVPTISEGGISPPRRQLTSVFAGGASVLLLVSMAVPNAAPIFEFTGEAMKAGETYKQDGKRCLRADLVESRPTANVYQDYRTRS